MAGGIARGEENIEILGINYPGKLFSPAHRFYQAYFDPHPKFSLFKPLRLPRLMSKYLFYFLFQHSGFA